MKKWVALFLALGMILSLAACGTKTETERAQGEEQKQESTMLPSGALEEKEEEKETAKEEKPEDTKPAPTEKPTEKPAEQPTEHPDTKPVPTETPALTKEPESTPAPTPTPASKTVGQTLLADFYAKAGGTESVFSLAEAIAGNPILAFSPATMPVEPGFLSGFDNAEITGFKEGAAFMPIIGSIPFIGYVFELADDTDAASFISTLKANANLRWNICVAAEEMVTGHTGNKVFFVMCPKEIPEE